MEEKMKKCPNCGYRRNPDQNTICLKCHKGLNEVPRVVQNEQKAIKEISKKPLLLGICRGVIATAIVLLPFSVLSLYASGFIELEIFLFFVILFLVFHLAISFGTNMYTKKILKNSDKQIELLEEILKNNNISMK